MGLATERKKWSFVSLVWQDRYVTFNINLTLLTGKKVVCSAMEWSHSPKRHGCTLA